MAKKKTGTTQKAYVSENRYIRNRTRKLTAHCKRHPEDAQAAAALKKGLTYARKAPHNKVWSPAKKELAHMVRLLGGNGHSVIQRPSGKAIEA